MNSKVISLLTLLHTHGLGRVRIRQLISDFGSAEKVVESGLKEKILFNKWTVGDWEEDLEEVERSGVKLLAYDDPAYPQHLLTIPDYPLLLYIKGEILPADQKGIALVGTRSATLYGKQAARGLAREMVASGISIISGLARGIDTAAHEGALEGGGRTLAVIGSGLSQLYPQENRGLAEKISSSGAVISEYPMQTPPAKGLFPRRNRIISGMALGVCLVESPLEGGGMLTMGLAEQQHKPRFAVPGRIDWPTFAGNHALIKENKAHLVENGRDMLKLLNITENQIVRNSQTHNLTPDEQALLTQLPAEEKSIDALVLLTQLPIMQLNILLTRLVLKKVVKEFPGKIYKKLNTW